MSAAAMNLGTPLWSLAIIPITNMSLSCAGGAWPLGADTTEALAVMVSLSVQLRGGYGCLGRKERPAKTRCTAAAPPYIFFFIPLANASANASSPYSS